jgi:hypothetical protein
MNMFSFHSFSGLVFDAYHGAKGNIGANNEDTKAETMPFFAGGISLVTISFFTYLCLSFMFFSILFNNSLN